ncbi:hypothetical protein JAAARDRAFT_51220 [Jaapia argillacea MUCL 33604]|uniref:Uncharacterized protein n=1 Tax=Jaapia argillacea MUCL 33604 TaxID=933084 RepID=A0A067PJH7_9AGAM|nr:hypothetical protein JAAARDRAFT_51220 [Jaapia argillacea MUCL 33604]
MKVGRCSGSVKGAAGSNAVPQKDSAMMETKVRARRIVKDFVQREETSDTSPSRWGSDQSDTEGLGNEPSITSRDVYNPRPPGKPVDLAQTGWIHSDSGAKNGKQLGEETLGSTHQGVDVGVVVDILCHAPNNFHWQIQKLTSKRGKKARKESQWPAGPMVWNLGLDLTRISFILGAMRQMNLRGTTALAGSSVQLNGGDINFVRSVWPVARIELLHKTAIDSTSFKSRGVSLPLSASHPVPPSDAFEKECEGAGSTPSELARQSHLRPPTCSDVQRIQIAVDRMVDIIHRIPETPTSALTLLADLDRLREISATLGTLGVMRADIIHCLFASREFTVDVLRRDVPTIFQHYLCDTFAPTNFISACLYPTSLSTITIAFADTFLAVLDLELLPVLRSINATDASLSHQLTIVRRSISQLEVGYGMDDGWMQDLGSLRGNSSLGSFLDEARELWRLERGHSQARLYRDGIGSWVVVLEVLIREVLILLDSPEQVPTIHGIRLPVLTEITILLDHLASVQAVEVACEV